MGKIRTLFITAAAVVCPLLAQSAGTAGELIRSTAAASVGVPISFGAAESANTAVEPLSSETEESPPAHLPAEVTQESDFTESAAAATEEAYSAQPEETEQTQPNSGQDNSPTESTATGRVISRNILSFTEEEQTSEIRGGAIIREYYGKSDATDHITLSSGAQVRNMTSVDNAVLLAASQQLPDIAPEIGSPDPQVLIVHTHTTESYEPCTRDWYDASLSSRTRDSSRNMVAIGEALAQALAAQGISVLHDGTIHDYPLYTGAYDRSEETIRAALEEYPSIKVVIDLHRDAIETADGSRIAPTAQINGKSAAQFMIITGCDDGRFGNMPNYIENFKLACLIQNTAENMYSGLARPVLFDYRNYNQHISTGSLLIEVGGHANSFEEAELTGQLLGELIAQAMCSICG